MSVKLFAENYRGLPKVEWELPRGISALVGPNGSGKTTLLDLPELFRHAIERGMLKAIDHHGGPASLRYMGADPTAPVMVGCELDDLRWEVDLSPVAVGAPAADTLLAGGKVFVQQSPHERHFTSGGGWLNPDPKPLPVRIADDPHHAAVLPLLSVLSSYRLYRQYHIWKIRVSGSPYSSDTFLHVNGENVFSLLRNWRDRRESRAR